MCLPALYVCNHVVQTNKNFKHYFGEHVCDVFQMTLERDPESMQPLKKLLDVWINFNVFDKETHCILSGILREHMGEIDKDVREIALSRAGIDPIVKRLHRLKKKIVEERVKYDESRKPGQVPMSKQTFYQNMQSLLTEEWEKRLTLQAKIEVGQKKLQERLNSTIDRIAEVQRSVELLRKAQSI